jgi:hypothetical protein
LLTKANRDFVFSASEGPLVAALPGDFALGAGAEYR